MYTWYILDTCPLLDKCFANIVSQCVAHSKFLSGPPSLLSSRPSASLTISMRVTLTLLQQFWQSFRCSDNLMAISTGIWTLMCPQMNLLSFPQSIPHLEQWHYLVSAGWDQLSLQTLDPRPSPGSIQCCLPIPGLQAACLALAWIAILALFLSPWLLTWHSPWLQFHVLP